MVWRNLEDMTHSDIAIQYFQTLLGLIRDGNPSELYCHLKEDIIKVPVPATVVNESSRVVTTLIQLPISADFSFRVNDGKREIGYVPLVHRSRELDQDNKPVDYDIHTKAMLNHQAGLRLRHLMPLNKKISFMNDLGIKQYVPVDESLIESLLSPHYAQTLDTLTLEALQGSD